MTQYTYMFSEVKENQKDMLGDKGSNLAVMDSLDIPVPPGFTIICQACQQFYKDPKFIDSIWDEIDRRISELEDLTSKKYGSEENPLLLSVRSGAPVSMPGMMDTILNVGINEEILKGLIEQSEDERFALDTYRRFIQMYSDVVIGIDSSEFEKIIQDVKSKISGDVSDADLAVEDLEEIINQYKQLFFDLTGENFPDDPRVQLYEAITAVFNSFQRQRAVYYRKINNIPDSIGTAVTIQQMVFGNYNERSMTGVAFTRDPSTGACKYMGEYLTLAQGEDVLAGIRTPERLSHMKEQFPEIYDELKQYFKKLEIHFKDLQQIEFTVEEGRVYLLQTRRGERTAAAQVKIAIDMMHEGILAEREAILRVDPQKLTQLLFKRIDESRDYDLISIGIDASPGAVTGEIVFDAEKAEHWANKGKRVILVRPETKPDDIHGLIAAEGILTAHGGKTSHAAVVARAMGKPAVCGATKLHIDAGKNYCHYGLRKLKEGDIITIDGTSGLVVNGAANLIDPELPEEFHELLEISDKIRSLDVRGNADTQQMAKDALKFGAQGIGLCRTEIMFIKPIIQEVLMAISTEERKKVLEKIKPLQKEHIKQILEIMEGKPVTIRLLDPPLHEFLPDMQELQRKLYELKTENTGERNGDGNYEDTKNLITLVESLSEANPMLGLRGCRLGILWPEINHTTCTAIFEAACELKVNGIEIKPEIMIPFVGFIDELKIIREDIEKIAARVCKDFKVELDYKIGTMIEVPRSALIAEEIAEISDFLSFGTNDLTQMTLAFSRDDAEGKFLPQYMEKRIVSDNPFEVIDKSGVGKLIEIAIENGKKASSHIETGVCGEHGGNPKSIEYCHSIGIDYVSCSPFQIPIARLAAAQAELKSNHQEPSHNFRHHE